jgi:hypothetical protein
MEIESKSCTINMTKTNDRGFILNILKPGDPIYVKASAKNQGGTSEYTPLQALPILLKSLPAKPYKKVYQGPSTN